MGDPGLGECHRRSASPDRDMQIVRRKQSELKSSTQERYRVAIGAVWGSVRLMTLQRAAQVRGYDSPFHLACIGHR